MKSTTWKEAFSSANGILSSKRIMGAISYLIILGCIVYLVVVEGATMIVSDLILTLMFMSAALLGLDSVTDIWKGKKLPGDSILEPPKPTEPSKPTETKKGA